jgi:cobalt-zinc-cadmium efflux system outer membrane protein
VYRPPAYIAGSPQEAHGGVVLEVGDRTMRASNALSRGPAPRNPGRTFCPLCLALLAGLLAGCAATEHELDHSWVAGEVRERTSHHMGPPSGHGEVLLHPGVSLEDGLSEDEAVTVALWNNAAFQEILVDLGLSRADLLQARLLPDPELWHVYPVGVKQLEYAIEFPIESLYLRPIRVAAARLENARVAARLVQSALDLIRDVRQGYADLLLARGRLRVAEEGARLRGRIAELAEARLRAGDASPLETATARIDALQAQQDLTRVRYDVTLAEERLRNLLGIGGLGVALVPEDALPLPQADLDVEALTQEAVATRPDALAAVEAVAAAEERLRLARLSWFRIFGIIDANSRGLKGHEIGPGLRLTLPFFNRNQGGIARAEAERERALRQQVTVHNQILLDVRRAFAQYQQARAELDILERQVRPEVEAAIRRTEKAYQEGSTTYLLVLESTRQLLDNRLRATLLHADLRRAWAELERSVGRRLGESCTSPSTQAAAGAKKEPHPEAKETTP